MTRCPL